MHLSKSDFKIASSCIQKLIYKKKGYKTSHDENEYMEMLAQGGYVVGKMAQLLYPGGQEIPADQGIEFSVAETKRLLDQYPDIVLFEAAFLVSNMFVRVDILEKKGNILNLIEVKAKSHNSEEDDGTQKRKLEEYIEDVAYQAMVLREATAGKNYEIHSYLLMPDKAKRTKIDKLAGWFKIKEEGKKTTEMEQLPARQAALFSVPLVEFVFADHPDAKEMLEELKSENILSLKHVDDDVRKMSDEIKKRAERFIAILENGINPGDYTINKICKSCEFQLGAVIAGNGYRECWGDLADTDPHIFDLYFGGSLGNAKKKQWYFDELIAQGKVSLYDIDPARLKNSEGEMSTRGLRQLLQITNTKSSQESIDPCMKEELEGWEYPLYFIDFETYTGAIPHHKGMRPYETIAFQWSCHTITEPGASPVHTGWINEDSDFPNFRFATTLMEQIGENGTPLMWATHENTVLRQILEQMPVFGYRDKTLEKWLTGIISHKKKPGRLVDMNAIAQQFYFHPYMKGRTSIKKVLPAVWNFHEYLHEIKEFKKYVSRKDGLILNPYDTLPPVMNWKEDEEEIVKDGTGAMRAYHEMMFGDPGNKQQLKQLLEQYCELDTMAMVIIWRYWKDACGT